MLTIKSFILMLFFISTACVPVFEEVHSPLNSFGYWTLNKYYYYYYYYLKNYGGKRCFGEGWGHDPTISSPVDRCVHLTVFRFLPYFLCCLSLTFI